MRHTCLTGNKCSCISNNRHGFRGEDNLDCRFAVGDRNTPEYSPAAKEGNLLFPENFTSIRRGFPDCPSLAEGDRSLAEGDSSLAEGDSSLAEGDSSLAEGDSSLAEGDRIAAEGDRIANESSGCRGPTGDVTVRARGTSCPPNKFLEK